MMTKFKNWPSYLLSYVAWIASFLLWVWFIFKSKEAISGLLIRYYLDGTFQRMKVFQFFNQSYYYVLGIGWLILMIIAEQYFRDGVKKKNLLTRICRFIGPELLLLFLADAIRATVSAFDFLNWLFLAVEILLGAGMIWYASTRPKPGIIYTQAKTNS